MRWNRIIIGSRVEGPDITKSAVRPSPNSTRFASKAVQAGAAIVRAAIEPDRVAVCTMCVFYA